MRLSARAFFRYWMPVIVMIGIIIAESTDLFSGAHTGAWLAVLLRWLHLKPHQLQELNHILRKLGHFFGYGFLSFVIFRGFRGTHRFRTQHFEGWFSARIAPPIQGDVFSLLWHFSWAFAALTGAAFIATCDELHQMRIPSRTGTWWDVLLDSTAALTFQLLIYVASRTKAARLTKRLK